MQRTAGSRGRAQPSDPSACFWGGSQRAQKALVVEGRDDESVMHESGFPDDPIDLGLAGEVGNVELAAADRFHVGERRPDEVLDAGILGSTYGRRRLLDLVGTWLPVIGD